MNKLQSTYYVLGPVPYGLYQRFNSLNSPMKFHGWGPWVLEGLVICPKSHSERWDWHQVCPPSLLVLNHSLARHPYSDTPNILVNTLTFLPWLLALSGWGWTLAQHRHVSWGRPWAWLLHLGLLGLPVLPGKPIKHERSNYKCNRRRPIQRFLPIKYFDSLATYLSSNLYLCLCLSETDFGRDGRCGCRDASFSSLDN